MKTSLLAMFVALVLIVGCAPQEAAPDAPPEAAPDAPPEAAPDAPPDAPPEAAPEGAPEGAPEEPPAKSGEDVVFNGVGGFDPAEIKITAGSTLNVLIKDKASSEYAFLIKETSDKSTKKKDGETAELTFDEAGDYTVLSIPFSRRLAVTVE